MALDRHTPSVPRAILFDVGLVLLRPDGEAISRALSQHVGTLVSPQRCVDAFRRTIHQRDALRLPEDAFDWWPAWTRFAGIPQELSPAAERFMTHFAKTSGKHWTDVEPGAATALERLARMGVKLGLVSNSHGELAQELAVSGLDRWVHVCLDSELEGCRKPNSTIFRRALKRVDAAAGHCWFVGDDYLLDIAPAAKLGFARAVHYDPLELYSPTPHALTLQRLDDLPRMIAQLEGPSS